MAHHLLRWRGEHGGLEIFDGGEEAELGDWDRELPGVSVLFGQDHEIFVTDSYLRAKGRVLCSL